MLSEKRDDPGSRGAARKALRKVTGEESSRRSTEGERAAYGDYIAGRGPVEVGDRAGFELRDRVAEALRLHRHDAELLDGALRQALATRCWETRVGSVSSRHAGSYAKGETSP